MSLRGIRVAFPINEPLTILEWMDCYVYPVTVTQRIAIVD